MQHVKFTSKIFTISGIANLQLLAGKPMRFVCCYIISDIKLAKPPVYRLIVFFHDHFHHAPRTVCNVNRGSITPQYIRVGTKSYSLILSYHSCGGTMQLIRV